MLNIGTTALIVGLVLLGEYLLAKRVGKLLKKKNKNRTRARIVYMNNFPKESDYPVEAY